MSTKINDNIFIDIAKKIGYTLEVGSIESYTLALEETDLESFLKKEHLPECIVVYSAMIKNSNLCFSLCLDWNKPEIDGILIAETIDMDNGKITYINKSNLKLEEINV